MRQHLFIFTLIFVFTVPAHAAEEIDVAAIFALTGPAARASASSIYGVRIAVDEVNAQGGVFGKPVNLIVFDNMSTPIGATTAAEHAADAGVTAIVGAAWSSQSLAIAKVAQSRGIPMISDFSTHPDLTAIGDDIFRVCFTDAFQGQVMARFAREDLKAESAAVVVNLTSDYSLTLSQIFREAFESMGGRVKREVTYKSKQIDFESQVKEILAAGVDVVIFSGHDESGLMAGQLQQAGGRAIPLGGDGWSTQSFLQKGGSTLREAYYCTHWSARSDDPRTVRFVDTYGGHIDFDVGTALAYDAVHLLISAIRRAGTTNGADIKNALSRTRDFKGVTGSISFNAQGDPVKSAVIMEITDGVPHYLKTLNP